jgi:hypothetical protein
MEKRIREVEAYVGESYPIYIFSLSNAYRHIDPAFLIT